MVSYEVHIVWDVLSKNWPLISLYLLEMVSLFLKMYNVPYLKNAAVYGFIWGVHIVWDVL